MCLANRKRDFEEKKRKRKSGGPGRQSAKFPYERVKKKSVSMGPEGCPHRKRGGEGGGLGGNGWAVSLTPRVWGGEAARQNHAPGRVGQLKTPVNFKQMPD